MPRAMSQGATLIWIVGFVKRQTTRLTPTQLGITCRADSQPAERRIYRHSAAERQYRRAD